MATWWQASRALGGNDLSWFYTFEWPIFAGIAIAAWWHLIHEDPADRAARSGREGPDPAERTGRVVVGSTGARGGPEPRAGRADPWREPGWLA